MVWSTVLPSFLASLVEFVEALTIVVVVGVTINWKSSLLGAGAAFLILAAIVGAFGVAIQYIPIDIFRIVVGVLLLLFGLQWLKKSVLRFSGLKAMHDEGAIYEEELRELKARGELSSGKFNGFGFAASLKSVLLEGLEVVFIVITMGAGKSMLMSALGATLAFLVVVLLGVTIRKPLTKLPENTLKYIVGVMLVTFGTFWSGEGLGVQWPAGDLFLLALIAFYALTGFVFMRLLKASRQNASAPPAAKKPVRSPILKALKAVFDFFCGDWRAFWGAAATYACLALLVNLAALPWIPWASGLFMMACVVATLWITLSRETAGKQGIRQG